jgi:hypothetical protein
MRAAMACACPLDQRRGFAGIAQLLERIGARGLEEPQARLGPGLGDHERLVHQRAEAFQRLPHVERVVGAHLLRAFRGEAAREDTEAAEYRLLALIEQAVAEVERPAQRLVSAQREARPAGEHVEALVEAARAIPRRRAAGREAAASSSASGMPSRRRQISSTAGTCASASAKRGFAACTRPRNIATAP